MAQQKRIKKTRPAKTLNDPPKPRHSKTDAKSTAKKKASKETVKTKTGTARSKKQTAPKKTAKRSSRKMETLINKNRISSDDLHRLIQERAYAIFEQNGYEGGREFEHWLEAEREVLKQVQ